MVFCVTCLQNLRRPGTTLNASYILFDGSNAENHENNTAPPLKRTGFVTGPIQEIELILHLPPSPVKRRVVSFFQKGEIMSSKQKRGSTKPRKTAGPRPPRAIRTHKKQKRAPGANLRRRPGASYADLGSRARCKALKQEDEYQNTLKSQMPHLNELFQNLEGGMTPTFLDIMSSISEMVAFYPECDQKFPDQEKGRDKRSQNKCRFCC